MVDQIDAVCIQYERYVESNAEGGLRECMVKKV
jgi:hypothetical protein